MKDIFVAGLAGNLPRARVHESVLHHELRLNTSGGSAGLRFEDLDFGRNRSSPSPVDSTRNYYETHSEDYFLSTYSAELGHAWEAFCGSFDNGALILDLGCGSGRDLGHFASRGFQTIGLDYSFGLLKLSKTFFEQSVVLADFLFLPFRNNVFDGVWAMASLLHVPRRQLALVFAEIHRVLKPNSMLFTSVKKGDGQKTEANGRYFEFYQPEEWAQLVQEAGYIIEKTEEVFEDRETPTGDSRQITWIQCLAKKL